MLLNDAADSVFLALKENAPKDCAVIKAYPDIRKPARLKKTVIAVSPAKCEIENVSLGGFCACCDFSVDIDIFIPQKNGALPDSAAAQSVLNAVSKLKPSAVKAGPLEGDDELGAFCSKITAVFDGECVI